MKKGDLKIKRKKKDSDWISYDPRISNDGRKFVLVLESGKKMSWLEALEAAYVFAKEEYEKIIGTEAHTTTQ